MKVAGHSSVKGFMWLERESVWQRDGLAVTAGDAPNTWSVTHDGSGRAVFSNMRNISLAQKAATLLLKLGDWRRDSTTVFADEDLHVASRELAGRLHRQGNW